MSVLANIYCIVLYCIVLYCIVLYCIVLYEYMSIEIYVKYSAEIRISLHTIFFTREKKSYERFDWLYDIFSHVKKVV